MSSYGYWVRTGTFFFNFSLLITFQYMLIDSFLGLVVTLSGYEWYFLEISCFYLILDCLSGWLLSGRKICYTNFHMLTRRTSPGQSLICLNKQTKIFCHLFAGNMLRDPEPELWPSEQWAVQPVAPVSWWWPLSSSDGRQRRSGAQRPRGDIVRRLCHCLHIRSVHGGRYVDL